VISNEKGRELEEAAAAIEGLILSSYPTLSGKSFLIESRKIVVKSGVRNEIDLFITVDPGGLYEAIFIFECKNWEAKVTKNEVTILSDKIRVTAANRGYLLAREFTKDAVNRAAEESRLELVPASPLPLDSIAFMAEGQYRGMQTQRCDSLSFIQANGERSPSQDWFAVEHDVHIVLDGNRIPPKYFLDLATEMLSQEVQKTFAVSPAGDFSREREVTLDGYEGRLNVDGASMSGVILKVSELVEVRRPRIQWGFDVQGRGKAVKYETVTFSDGSRIGGFVAWR
jgi:hypothetical protein